MKLSIEKQREKILKKLDEHYSFTFIENYISIEEIIDSNCSYQQNIELLKIYLSEELLVGEFSSDIMKAMGVDHFMRLKDDLTSEEFERVMAEEDKKN